MLTITDLSRATGVPSSALRFYESIGLLASRRRTSGGYRLFDPDAADRVRFIRMAQDAGLTLDDVRAVLEPRGSGATCAAVRGVIQRRLDHVRAKLVALRRLEIALERGLDCRPRKVSDLCRELCRAAGTDCDAEATPTRRRPLDAGADRGAMRASREQGRSGLRRKP
jgi:DNA-binding transcriptional MerR regulator